MATKTQSRRLFDFSPVINLHQSLAGAPLPSAPSAPHEGHQVSSRDFAATAAAADTAGLGDFERLFLLLGTESLAYKEGLSQPYKNDYASDGVTYLKSSNKSRSVQWSDKLTDGETTDTLSDSTVTTVKKLSKKQRSKANQRARRAAEAAKKAGTVSETEADPVQRTPTPAGRAGSHIFVQSGAKTSSETQQPPPTFDLNTSVKIARDRVQEKLREIKQPIQDEPVQNKPAPTPPAAQKPAVTTPKPKNVSAPWRPTSQLLPATIQPKAHGGRWEIKPLLARSDAERHMDLYLKLYKEFVEDRYALSAPMHLIKGNQSGPGIHVFIDASNIFIGLKDQLKRVRKIPEHAMLPNVDLSFDAFALLLERRRPVARRILLGSKPQLPAHIKAEQVGYECNLLERVNKQKALTAYDIKQGVTIPKQGKFEQGVDEILHLKMLQSVVDYDRPSIMVVATGDAAKAEFSDGFLANVKRALHKGWKVELVSWSKNINRAYQDPNFLAYWAGQFEIIFLDDYAEELLNMQP